LRTKELADLFSGLWPRYSTGPQLRSPFCGIEPLRVPKAVWRTLALPETLLIAIKQSMAKCAEYDRLHAEVENILGNLAQVTMLLLEMFRSKNLGGVHRLDKQLELTVGEKERSLGAFRQHIKEHNCMETPVPSGRVSTESPA
jgi:hypothetical protein